MRVFVTGATGFIGTEVVRELLAHGHSVLGMTRSDEGAAKLRAAGADVHHGELSDLDSLSKGAEQAEGVIHLAFDHTFSDFITVTEKDRRAIGALAAPLAGSSRPLLVTSGTGMGMRAPGQPADEDFYDAAHQNPRKASEEAAVAAAEKGVNVSVVRLPQVHDTRKQGLITRYVDLARQTGVAAYVGDGKNRWPAAHVSDVARLYRLALEKQQPGSRYNAVAEEGIPMLAIAEVVAQGLNVPVRSLPAEEAPAHFGWLAMFVGYDMPASSAKTRERLNWTPTGPVLLEDLKNMDYTRS